MASTIFLDTTNVSIGERDGSVMVTIRRTGDLSDAVTADIGITADSATNGVFTLAPNLLLYASLIEASPFLGNDARVAVWTTLYEDLLAKVQAADSRDRYSGDVRTANTEAQRT